MDSLVSHPERSFYFLLHLSQGHRMWLLLSCVGAADCSCRRRVPEEGLAGLCRTWETAGTVPMVLRLGKAAHLLPPLSCWAAFPFPSISLVSQVGPSPVRLRGRPSSVGSLGLGFLIQIPGGK